MTYQVIHGDSLDVLRQMDDNSIDAIVTDPPAGIAFMNSHWDRDKGGRDQWIAWMAEVAAECLRVIKPGGHALVWAIPRTSHWTGMAWEQAGWEPRDKVYHAFGSGFPKSLDVSKAIDKAAGAEREKVPATGGLHKNRNLNDDGWSKIGDDNAVMDSNIPATDAARQWDGWGTALKPAVEEWWLFRKPLTGTVAANVLQWGTGALNIDACRVASGDVLPKMSGKAILGGYSDGWDRPWKNDPDGLARRQLAADAAIEKANTLGRWPANLVHDGSDEAADGLGHAARFFYCAKASRRERDAGLEGMPLKRVAMLNAMGDDPPESIDPVSARFTTNPARNHHATVKPIALMEWLIKLVTPPGGVVLDPFAGSGTTGCAAARLGVRSILIEREAEYVEIARRRVAHWSAERSDADDLPLFRSVQE